MQQNSFNIFFQLCVSSYQPVCASDGCTYNNECEAENHRVWVYCWRECPCPRMSYY